MMFYLRKFHARESYGLWLFLSIAVWRDALSSAINYKFRINITESSDLAADESEIYTIFTIWSDFDVFWVWKRKQSVRTFCYSQYFFRVTTFKIFLCQFFQSLRHHNLYLNRLAVQNTFVLFASCVPWVDEVADFWPCLRFTTSTSFISFSINDMSVLHRRCSSWNTKTLQKLKAPFFSAVQLPLLYSEMQTDVSRWEFFDHDCELTTDVRDFRNQSKRNWGTDRIAIRSSS